MVLNEREFIYILWKYIIENFVISIVFKYLSSVHTFEIKYI